MIHPNRKSSIQTKVKKQNDHKNSNIKKALNEIEGINKQIDLLNKTINNQIK